MPLQKTVRFSDAPRRVLDRYSNTEKVILMVETTRTTRNNNVLWCSYGVGLPKSDAYHAIGSVISVEVLQHALPVPRQGQWCWTTMLCLSAFEVSLQTVNWYGNDIITGACGGPIWIGIFEVNLIFEILTVRGQWHSFSTHERMFL